MNLLLPVSETGRHRLRLRNKLHRGGCAWHKLCERKKTDRMQLNSTCLHTAAATAAGADDELMNAMRKKDVDDQVEGRILETEKTVLNSRLVDIILWSPSRSSSNEPA